MGRIYLPTWNMMRTSKFAVIVFLQDIQRLVQEQQTEGQNYLQNPLPLINPALFQARAKGIELLLLLGVAGEYLFKTVLLKHGFILNREVKRLTTQQFPQNLLNMISQLGNSQNQLQIDAIYKVASALLGQVSGRTIGFAKCIRIFNNQIVSSSHNYYANLQNNHYNVANQETMNLFGRTVDTGNAPTKIMIIRHNYAHLPDRMYEETELVEFLFNFLVFIAKTEFPAEMANLQYM